MAESLPEILIVTDSVFPAGSADANNIHGHCRAISEIGLSVGVLAKPPAESTKGEGVTNRGVRYWLDYDARRGVKLQRVLRSCFALDDDRLAWLHQRGLKGVKAVIAFPGQGGTVGFLLRLRHFCRSWRVPVFMMVVEWFDGRHNAAGPFSFSAFDGEVQRRFINRRFDGTICISEFLRDYYRSRGGRSILVPPLLDLDDSKWTIQDCPGPTAPPKPLRILFSGTPARDRQDMILRSIQKVRKQGPQVVMEYLGSSRANIETLPGVGSALIDSLGDAVRFHGRVPDNQVLQIASSASFGIIMRDDVCWSRACFPSKVPEFLAVNVPMICNLTSDLSRYLRDKHNAIISAEASVPALCEAIERAALLGEDHFRELKKNAGLSARQFQGSNYAQTYRELFARL